MKEFYGNASVIINFNFSGVKSNSLEEAIDIILGAEEIKFSLINKKNRYRYRYRYSRLADIRRSWKRKCYRVMLK